MHNKSGIKSILFVIIISLIAGCAQKNEIEKAQERVREYEANYKAAISLYQGLIKQGKNLDLLHFELGQLYFGHSDFSSAREEFKKITTPQARKFLAICYYSLGDYSEALKILDDDQDLDGQALYYYGLACEKLNLFDKAIASYKKIKPGVFADKAKARLVIIEKEVYPIKIQEIDPGVYAALTSVASERNDPQAGAQIVLCDEKIEITPDNKEISYLHYLVRILNERGKQNFSESRVEYDSTYEKVELEYARTIKPDGTVVDVGTRHIRDVSKYLNFPLYSNARVYIISFPEIAEGSSIEYKIKVIRNQLINKKDFIGAYPLQSDEPIIAADFTIELPEGKTLYLKTLNEKYNNFGAELKPVIEQKANKTIYRWHFKNIPQIIPEANMAPVVEVNPTVLFSSFQKWDDVYSWWWDLAKDKIAADAAIKEKVKELTLEAKDAEVSLRKIYNFCAKEIRYVAVEYGQAGYEPHQAADIFKNKYGDCKDQAILLVTMLKEAGFSAWPVLIGTKGSLNLNPDFPGMLFNHCIAAVSWRDRVVFMDPTAETCSFTDLPGADQNRRVLSCKADGYKIEGTPLYPAGHNLAQQFLEIKINADESVSGQKSVLTHGVYDQAERYWLLYTVPDLVREEIQSRVQDVSIGGTLDGYNIENLDDLDKAVKLSYGFHGPEYFTAGGILRIMPQLASVDTSLVAKEKRNYPIDFNILEAREAELILHLSANFVIKYMPQNITEDSPWLEFTTSYKQEGTQIIFQQKTELKKTMITESEYADFKKFYEILAKKIKQRIVLERIR